MQTGKLIVIDGLDGSGKSTQHELLIKNLKALDKGVSGISFPDYDSPSSSLIKMYLGGEFGEKPSDVNAYAASAFYAVDRFASFKKNWGQALLSGTNIIAARYTSSNLFHQTSKLEKSEWDGFIDWNTHFEYDLLGLPRPELVFFLDMPIDVSQGLIKGRYDKNEGKRDIHESDLAYLEKCREAALYVSAKLGYKVIDCAKDELALSIDKIQEILIYNILEALNFA